MPTNNDLVLRPVSELLNEAFFIPAYQRGYRWTRRQVTELLDDISEFQRDSEQSAKSAFYCLQPVVVKKLDGEWELVDGQQRLTTIHIILGYLKDILAVLGKAPYSLRYETRPSSASYLKEIDDVRHKDNVDFFHMYKAKQAIHEWFESRDGTYKIKFLQTLLNDDDSGKNVKVIWYQINENIDATAVFTRLNLGKIPLTNAELVKALFLKGSNFKSSDRYLSQLKIAQEWSEVERALQSDDFWFFITNQGAEANRIELVLSLVADDLSAEGHQIPRRDSFYVFLTFARWLRDNNTPIERSWERVKRCFMVLKEWHEDRTVFHLVGFLVSRGTGVGDLLSVFRTCKTKAEFRRRLTIMVYKKALPELPPADSFVDGAYLEQSIRKRLSEVSYHSPHHQVVSVLLLFNIATLLVNPKTNARFQFDRFKTESWDIEHIRSVASEVPRSKDRQKAWVQELARYIETAPEDVEPTANGNTSSQSAIGADAKCLLVGDSFDSVAFEEFFQRVHEHYAPDGSEKTDHSIGNLTLLDSSTNRSYKNAIFPIKRKRVIGLDKTATFVPVCTKNVFLKYYSEQVDHIMLWESRDSANYQAAMIEILVAFYKKEVLAA